MKGRYNEKENLEFTTRAELIIINVQRDILKEKSGNSESCKTCNYFIIGKRCRVKKKFVKHYNLCHWHNAEFISP